MSRKEKLPKESNANMPAIGVSKETVSTRAYMQTADNDAENIHRENVQFLEQMSESEILDERKKLMQSIGKFLQNTYITICNIKTMSLHRSQNCRVSTIETKY